MIVIAILLCILCSRITVQTSVESTFSASGCGDVGDCLTECDDECECDKSIGVYYYNETLNECVIDLKRLLLTMGEKYNNEEKIQREANRVFRGIYFSAVFVICCTGIGAFVACIYCCHVNHSDQKLKADVDALAKKLGKKKPCKAVRNPKVNLNPQVSQSCNVIVEDSGLFVC